MYCHRNIVHKTFRRQMMFGEFWSYVLIANLDNALNLNWYIYIHHFNFKKVLDDILNLLQGLVSVGLTVSKKTQKRKRICML